MSDPEVPDEADEVDEVEVEGRPLGLPRAAMAAGVLACEPELESERLATDCPS